MGKDKKIRRKNGWIIAMGAGIGIAVAANFGIVRNAAVNTWNKAIAFLDPTDDTSDVVSSEEASSEEPPSSEAVYTIG